MAAVPWTLGARDDLRSIVSFIARDSAIYAATVGGRIATAANGLERYPRSGRMVPEYEDPDLRELMGDIIVDGVSLRNLLIKNGFAREYYGEAKQSWC